jgi:hypothetical protein
MTTLSVLGAMLVLPVLFLAPGWLWLRRCGVSPFVALYGGFGATAAFAAATVGLAQLLPWSVRTTCVAAFAVVVILSLWCWRTAQRPLLPARAGLAGVGVFLAADLAAASFVALPSDPYAFWNVFTIGPGRIESPRWAGQPVDNILPYRTGQVAFFKQGGELRDRFATGWWISDRTPLVGLDFAFGAGALGVNMRSDDPTLKVDVSTQMQLKDPYAWWFYNFVSILFASAVVLGVFMLAVTWKRDYRIATAAALIAALAPGFFLNEIYTWPKQATAYFILGAASFALDRRALLAGAFVGLAYLVHAVGVFYLLPVALLLLFEANRRGAWGPALARFASAAVLVVLPWQLFTSLKLHAISKLALWPLGGFTELRTHPFEALSQAWHGFVARGLLVNVWDRVSSTAFSFFPTDLQATPTRNTDVVPFWATAHGMSIWGTLGLVLFPATIIWLGRNWNNERRMVALFVIPFLIPTILAAGSGSYGDAWAHQSAYALVGLLCIWAGLMLLSCKRWARWLIVAAMALELFTVAYGAEYRPYNTGQGTTVLFAVLAIGTHIALIVALLSVLSLNLPKWQQLRSRLAPTT